MANSHAFGEKNLHEISFFLNSRLNQLQGKDQKALIEEFKEWFTDEKGEPINIWSIPDLTDERLCDFFLRAISQK